MKINDDTSNYYQRASFFKPGGHFNRKKLFFGSWKVQQGCLRSIMLAQENYCIGLLTASPRTANKIRPSQHSSKSKDFALQ